ncbi:SGNH/GDSL hydrolase family protein [Promicromonospora sp. Populi]|uniref:SGNH/GDSL hydrolase family protein n=1 Tax=Promicromonospora sp. Populi TaxID=3239420 RepID=UPI0034E2CDAC
MKRWLVNGGIAVSVVVAIAAALLVGMSLGSSGVAVGRTEGSSPAPRAAPSPFVTGTAAPSTGAPASVTTVVEEQEEQAVALFVGDSYTVGEGASSPEQRWSTVVSRELDWVEVNVAQGGTGYVSNNPDIPKLSYEEQLSAAPTDGVDFVVIAGGQNDFPELRDDPQEVYRAVSRTFRLAAERFPEAELVAVGPSTPWDIGLEVHALDSAVRAAAERYDATYVSLVDPDVVLDRFVDEDNVHVNDDGYAAIARRVIAQIS